MSSAQLVKLEKNEIVACQYCKRWNGKKKRLPDHWEHCPDKRRHDRMQKEGDE